MKKKSKRLRGSQTHGRGWKSSKHKGGSRGGVGKAGSWTHKLFSKILDEKARIKAKKVTNIRDLESKLERYIKKGYFLIKKDQESKEKLLIPTHKFYNKYQKVLGVGEPSYKYFFDPYRIKISKTVKSKLL